MVIRPMPVQFPQVAFASGNDGGMNVPAATSAVAPAPAAPANGAPEAEETPRTRPTATHFRGPPSIADSADMVLVSDRGARMVVALMLAVPAFWLTFGAALLIFGQSLLAGAGYGLGAAAVCVLGVCCLSVGPDDESPCHRRDADRVPRPLPPQGRKRPRRMAGAGEAGLRRVSRP